MSCQLPLLSQFQDISTIKRFLFPFLKDATPDPQSTEDGWSASWEWAVDSQLQEEEEEEIFSKRRYHETWLQNSIISLSPANDLLAIANEDRIILLAQKYDPQETDESLESKFTTVWQASLKQEEGEHITAILCLPLASQKRSTQGAPDWTCVIVGFSSGYIRMYTESGTLLLSQLLHDEPVQKLKCKSYESPRYLGMAEQHEELMIVYKKAFLTIEGFSLFQSLRACRNQVARAAASHSESLLQAPPLAYKKWSLHEQDQILDQCSGGICSPSTFTQMTTASNVKGFYSAVRLSPPATSLYITAGAFPYVGFFYAEEGSMQPILSDVAYAVASKLKSAFVSAASGLLGFGSENKERKKARIEQATTLPLRFGLPDKRRHGESIVLSPNNSYAATTDSYGRVILIDVHRGIGVRMWKGYRDAQVGWVQVKEEKSQCTNSKLRRIAQFLVIYAPRRGILEVWTAVNGPRVAAFNVSKSCCLICPGYGMMGLNNVTSRDTKNRTFQVALIDTNGLIKTVDVPFHLALSDKSSKRACNLHLLKKLKTILKENSEESESLKNTVKDILLDMKIASIAQQGVERVLNTKYLSPNMMRFFINSCIKQLSAKAEETLDIDSRLFLQFCQSQDQLLRTYSQLDKINCTCQPPKEIQFLEQCLMSLLSCTKSEIEHILKQLHSFCFVGWDVSPLSEHRFVTFNEQQQMTVTSFLSCFEYPIHLHENQSDSPNSKTDEASEIETPSPPPATNMAIVSQIKKITEDKKTALSYLFFDQCLSGKVGPEDLSLVLQDSTLSPEHLMDLLQHYWLLSDNRSIESQVPNLHHIITVITAMTDTSDVLTSVDSISPWWEKVREACAQSTNGKAAYILTLTARGVAMEMMINKNKAKDPDADTSTADKLDNSISEWEDVSVDIEKWNVLIRQLEDVLALNCLLKLKIPPAKNTPSSSTPSDLLMVSVRHLLDGGRGSIPEVVAKYVSKAKFSHEALNYPRGKLSIDAIEIGEEPAEQLHVKFEERFLGQLDLLQGRFPHSLDNDVLLANCCWEYIVLWNKDLEQYQYLQSSFDYLNAIQNAVLRQGLGSMLWQMFVVKRLSTAAHLMEKVAKSPKDRLCRKEIGLSDNVLVHFIGLVSYLLGILMKSNSQSNCEADEVPVFNIEPLWQNVRGPASLVELAVDQKATNYGLLLHHFQLCWLMHAILMYGLKSVKVLSLFDCKVDLCRKVILQLPQSFPSIYERNCVWPALKSEIARIFSDVIDQLHIFHIQELYARGLDKNAEEGQNSFFKDLHSHPALPTKIKDATILADRLKLYKRIISHYVEDYSKKEEKDRPSNSVQLTFMPWDERNCVWPALKSEIARIFSDVIDQLHIFHIQELYARGLDKNAEEVMLTISISPELGESLLEITGQRIKHYLDQQIPSRTLEIYSTMTTAVSGWIKKQDPSILYRPECNVEDIRQLLNHVFKCLEEETPEYNLALELINVVQSLL